MQSSFGATRVGKRRVMNHPCVPITHIQCPHCGPESPAEYVVWGDRNATEAENQGAVALFARLIREGHPEHKPLSYAASTLEELSEQLWHKLAESLFGDLTVHKLSSEPGAQNTM